MWKIFKYISDWLERRRNLRRYNKGRKDYEAAVGANQLFVEGYVKKRKRNA